MPVVSGTIFEKDNTNQKRIPNTRIIFTSEDRTRSFRTRSNASGRYKLDIPPERYVVTAHADHYINYNSNPGFAVVRQGQNTFNIFMDPINREAIRTISEPVVVDANLNAFKISQLLTDRTRIEEIVAARRPTDTGKPELPLTPDGTLAAGVLYDSPNDANLKYYLPEYVLRIVDTQYTTRLKFRDTDADPHGPIASLVIEFVAAEPQDHRFTLKEIDHEAIVRLGYQMDISDDDSGTGSISEGIDDFVGEWVNVDPNTRGMTRLNITRKTNTAGSMHGFGSCSPQDCDWGEIPSTFGGDQMTGVYRFGFKDLHITVRRTGDQLHATLFSDYAEDDRRADKTDEYILRRESPIPETNQDSPTLWINIGAVERVSRIIRRCEISIHSKEEYDRLFQIMSDPGHNARLEIQCRATMGHRSWRQIFVGNVLEKVQKKPFSVLDFALNEHVINRVMDFHPGVLHHIPDIVEENTPEVRLPSNVSVFRDPEIINHLNPPTATIRRNFTPMLNMVIANDLIRLSDEIETAVPRRTTPLARRAFKVPARVLVDEVGEPVITRRELTAVQTLSPFWFNTETHGYMFDIPETPTTRHILLRHDIRIDDSTVTFYQDSILREQIYYEPQVFRLARIATEPYPPDLLFAFNDVTQEEDGDAVTVDYRVRLAYRVLPDVDQRFLNQARLEFDEGASFTALAPSEASLVLRLPDDEADTWIPVTRSDAQISFDEGIVDEVELTSGQFQKVFSAFQSPATVGIEGTVEGTLLDGTPIDISVEVSLQENTGTLFDSQFAATGSPGEYTITLTNRIESTVNINRVDPVKLNDTAIAHPVGLSLPIRVNPGSSITITYNVNSPETAVTTITPVLETTIDVNYEQLWSLITINQGFVKQTFDITVSIQPQFFSATPTGMEPLTSVLVEFDSLVVLELTPEQTQITLPLRMPLLPVLLNQMDAAQSYRYRVINQHANGPGAMSDWTQSSGNLQIVPPRGD